MTKVLHISKYYPPDLGGIEDVCYNLVKIVDSNTDIDQQILCFNSCRSTSSDIYEGIRTTRVGCLLKVASQPIPINYKKRLRRILSETAPDVVHFHAPNPLIGKYLLRLLSPATRLIVHWHSDIIAQKHLYGLVKKSEARLLERAEKIIATSPNYVEHSRPLSPFKSKVVVIPNIIDIDRFALTPRTKQLADRIKKSYDNKPIVFFLGRHVPYKGIEHLLAASTHLKNDCEILIGGTGKLTSKLKRLNVRPNVHFIGRIPQEDVAGYYHAADIFAFPSVSKNEAFGVALAEAMYCEAVPVTFTIAGSGVNWVNLDRQTGLETENKNSVRYAQAIDYLLENPEIRLNYARKSKQRIERMFVKDVITSKIVDLYR